MLGNVQETANSFCDTHSTLSSVGGATDCGEKTSSSDESHDIRPMHHQYVKIVKYKFLLLLLVFISPLLIEERLESPFELEECLVCLERH